MSDDFDLDDLLDGLDFGDFEDLAPDADFAQGILDYHDPSLSEDEWQDIVDWWFYDD
jgi:hypothetical protein